MSVITPEQFWREYRAQLLGRGLWNDYETDGAWTPTATAAARATCEKFDLLLGSELYLDVSGWEWSTTARGKVWDLRVAFEHENKGDWHKEFCKLCHVVADLRVLVAFYQVASKIESRLQQAIDGLGERLYRVQASNWLFAFGPSSSLRGNDPYLAFTLGVDGKTQPIHDDCPLIPCVHFACVKDANDLEAAQSPGMPS